MPYNSELWIGEMVGVGYNYEIKGVPADDYKAKVIICQEMIKRLKEILDFYTDLVERNNNETV